MNKTTETQKKFMKEAIDLSIENSKSTNGGPFGCVIVKNDKIIAKASNAVTTSNDPTAHAEIQAIRKACQHLNSFQLTDCEIYSSCEPCPMCFGAIYWARPKNLFYANTKEDAANAGFDDQFIYDELAKPKEERFIKMVKMNNTNAIEAFDNWRASTIITKY